jgi:indolepyruvate ferredoxin oxidoreductase
MRYNLHPPMLRSLGRSAKVQLSRRWTPVLELLAAMKVVRGTPFDPFGYTKVRRLERKLAAQYLEMVTELSGALSEGTYDDAVAAADAAEIVRGYEDIKVANVRRYVARLESLGRSVPSLGLDGS